MKTTKAEPDAVPPLLPINEQSDHLVKRFDAYYGSMVMHLRRNDSECLLMRSHQYDMPDQHTKQHALSAAENSKRACRWLKSDRRHIERSVPGMGNAVSLGVVILNEFDKA